jgi:chitodextrinase
MFHSFYKMVAACLVLASLLGLAGVTHAAGITSFSLELSRLEAGEVSNHTMSFVTPSGVGSAGDSIVVTYAAAFDLAALAMPGDLDLALDDDGSCDGPFVDLALAGAAAPGVWGASVAGQNVILAPPSDAAAGEVPSGRCLQLEIGTHASFGSSGAGQIVNPSSSGSYTVTVGGGFGDSGAAAVAIADSDEVSITAEVSGAPVGGGGAGAPSGCDSDSVAPNIFNVLVDNVTDTSATVSWDTDEAADGTVDYGTTAAASDASVSDSALVSSHSFELADLAPGTTYYLLLRSADNCGNTAVYGPLDFTTSDAAAPVIAGVQVTDQTTTSCTVQWLTDELSDSAVDYGATAAYEIGTVSDPEVVTDHLIIVTGLEPGTLYHFRARSEDAVGNSAYSEDITCTTEADLPPANVTLAVTSACGANTLSWVLPSDPDLIGVRVVYLTDGYPTDPFDGTLLYNALGTSFTHSGLSGAATYYYGVFAYDESGNFASGALAAATPSCPPAEEEAVPPSAEEEIVPPAEEVPVVGARLDESAIVLYVSGGTIRLGEVADSAYRLLLTQPFIVSLLAAELAEQIESAQFAFNGGLYNLSPATTAQIEAGELVGPITQYVFGSLAILEAPAAGSYPSSITVNYVDGTSQTFNITIEVAPFGYVFETVEGVTERLAGVELELFSNATGEWLTWDAAPYIQDNPLTSSADGEFAWYVPNGEYDVRVSTPGYLEARTGTLTVEDNIVNPTVRLFPVPIEIPEIIEAPLPLEEKLNLLLETLLGGAEARFETARRSAAAEAAAAPLSVLATVSLALGFAALASWFNLVGYARYLSAFPGIWLFKGKELVGLVYNAVGKTAVRCAELRLYLVEKKKTRFLRNAITDERGNYSFGVHRSGLYLIVVRKEGYRFPSERLLDRDSDGPYRHLYHGELLEIREQEATIATAIPLDPVKDKWEDNDAKRRRLIQNALSMIAILTSLLVLTIRPDQSAQLMVALSLLLLLFTKRLTKKVR